ncbi:MAG: restriction endonuclease subunit S [Candidatus Pacebacteria bacterium]|nr:restriction endonuclease subunit S [Candidatus Paceibacterota bacterium]
MIEWKEFSISDIAEVQTGPFGSQLHQKDYKSVGTPIITVEHLGENKIIHNNLPLVGDEDKERLKKYIIYEGDIVFSRVGSVDRRAYVSKHEHGWMFSGRLLRVRPHKQFVNPQFLSYYFGQEDFKEHIRRIAVGATMPSINTSILSNIKIVIPPISEQKAIAGVLSSLDDKIDLLHRQNKTLETLAETIFRQWFVEEVEEDWEEHQIGDFVEVMRGLSYKGACLTDKENGVPMHNLNSVYEGGGYKYEGIKYYNGPYQDRHKVYPGDVIITNTEQGHDLLLIGYPAIVPKFFGNEGIFSQHIYRLKIFDNRITNQFLYYLLMSYDVREQITGATNGSTVNMLAKDGIEWAIFKLPPKPIINVFSMQVQKYWDKKENNIRQIHTLEKLRDTLLPKLMSGEVRVKYGSN